MKDEQKLFFPLTRKAKNDMEQDGSLRHNKEMNTRKIKYPLELKEGVGTRTNRHSLNRNKFKFNLAVESETSAYQILKLPFTENNGDKQILNAYWKAQ